MTCREYARDAEEIRSSRVGLLGKSKDIGAKIATFNSSGILLDVDGELVIEIQGSWLTGSVGIAELGSSDRQVGQGLVGEFAAHFSCDVGQILSHEIIRLFPRSLRPYGRLYAHWRLGCSRFSQGSPGSGGNYRGQSEAL